MIHYLLNYWQYKWYRLSVPDGLGILRILFYLTVFSRLGIADPLWGDVDRVFWYPISFFTHFDYPVPSSDSLAFLGTIWTISVVLSCVGLLR